MRPTVDSLTGTLLPEQDRLLNARLDGLCAATQSLAAPAHVEAQLMVAFKARQAKNHAQKRRSEFFTQWFAPGFALAASVGMGAWMVLAPMAQPVLDVVPAVADTRIDTDTPFIAFQSLEQIALEPRPRVIASNVPRMVLASYGVPVNPQSAGDSVRAEMLVSASGQLLGMRFLP
jgi:hypothetical protein